MKEPVSTGSTVSSQPRSTRSLRGSSFNRRFAIAESHTENFRQFKNRTLHTIDGVLGIKFLSNERLEQDYLYLLGRPCSTTVKQGITSMIAASTLMGLAADKDFAQTSIYKSLSEEDSLTEYYRCLDGFFHLPLAQADLQGLYEGFSRDIEASTMPVRISHRGDSYALYPRGPGLLDGKVIDDDLEWLSDYKAAMAPFRKALAQYSDPTKQREALDLLRFSFEKFLQQLLGNKAPLEKNGTALVRWMDAHGANTDTRNMMKGLFESYWKYQDNNVKHNDESKPAEVDFVLYLTATFIHLLIELARSTMSPSLALDATTSGDTVSAMNGKADRKIGLL